MKPGAFRLVFLVSVWAPLILSLVGSRWLTRFPVGPINLSDLLLILASIAGVAAAKNVVRKTMRKEFLAPLLLLSLMPMIALGKFLLSDWSWPAAIEFHAFGLFFSAPLFFVVLHGMSFSEKRILARLVFSALFLHWIWVTFVNSFGPGPTLQVRRGTLEVFSVRADFDTALLGVFASALIARWASSKGSIFGRSALTLAGVVVFQSTQMGTRAGFVSTVAVLVVTFAILGVRETALQKKLVRFSGGALVAVIALGGALNSGLARELGAANLSLQSRAESYSRINEIVDSSRGLLSLEDRYKATPDSDGFGTASARLASWELLGTKIWRDEQRFFLGGDFGENFFESSGAKIALEGSGSLPVAEGGNRWPHNWFLSLVIFFGVPGAILVGVGVAWVGWRLVWAAVRREDPLDLLATQTLVAIIVVSMFGVVAEMPFGAIPLAWALAVGAGQANLQNKLDR